MPAALFGQAPKRNDIVITNGSVYAARGYAAVIGHARIRRQVVGVRGPPLVRLVGVEEALGHEPRQKRTARFPAHRQWPERHLGRNGRTFGRNGVRNLLFDGTLALRGFSLSLLYTHTHTRARTLRKNMQVCVRVAG